MNVDLEGTAVQELTDLGKHMRPISCSHLDKNRLINIHDLGPIAKMESNTVSCGRDRVTKTLIENH